MTETEKYRNLTEGYCVGCGVDIGSGGNPVVQNAMSMDLPMVKFDEYNSGTKPYAVHLPGDARNLRWFKDGVLDYVYSSHLIEDFEDWYPLLTEWARVVKSGGYIVIIVPDKELWNDAVRNGQPPNCAHLHEGYVGELTMHFDRIGGVKSVVDRLTALWPGDYSILYVGEKL